MNLERIKFKSNLSAEVNPRLAKSLQLKHDHKEIISNGCFRKKLARQIHPRGFGSRQSLSIIQQLKTLQRDTWLAKQSTLDPLASQRS